MTSYNCPNAKREAGKPLLVCTKSGKPCLNQRYCPQSKQTVLTAYAKDCPGRTGATDSSAPLGMTGGERTATDHAAPAKTEAEKPKKKAAARRTKEKAD